MSSNMGWDKNKTKNILIIVTVSFYMTSAFIHQSPEQLMFASFISAFILSLSALFMSSDTEEDKKEHIETGCSAFVPCKEREKLAQICDEKLAKKDMEIHTYQQEINCKITGQAVTIPVWLLDNCIFVLNDQSNRSKVAKASLPYLLDRKAKHKRKTEGMKK